MGAQSLPKRIVFKFHYHSQEVIGSLGKEKHVFLHASSNFNGIFFLQLVAFESLSQNPSMELITDISHRFREKETHRLKQRSLGGDVLVA